MQHSDHATNQPHNPATKCNNKLMQPKGRKRIFPHKSAKCNIIIQQIMHPKRKPQHTKSCNPKGRKEKFMNFLQQQTMQKPKGKKRKIDPNLMNLANCPKGRKSP
jgi:hypothetical protein